MPASMTPNAQSPSMPATLSGRPISLLKFPAVRAVFPAAASASATSSFVLVLPTEPVTPTTRADTVARYPAANRPSAASTSSTRRKPPSPGSFPTGKSSRTTAPAPAAETAARKSWPSARSPLSAKNKSPGPARRLSTPSARSGPDGLRGCHRPRPHAAACSGEIGFIRRDGFVAAFPRNGKLFRGLSTQWKKVFHQVENRPSRKEKEKDAPPGGVLIRPAGTSPTSGNGRRPCWPPPSCGCRRAS